MKCSNCEKEVEFPYYDFSIRGGEGLWFDVGLGDAVKRYLPLIPKCPFCGSKLYNLFALSTKPREGGE